MARKNPQVLVLITEGVDFQLLSRWIATGQLNTFGSLFRHGCSGPLRSHHVPYEVPGLLTALSGFRSADHGCFSYWHARNYDYRPTVISSADVRKSFIWRREELRHKGFLLLNLFGSHPPYPVPGYMITYPTTPTLHACFPADLLVTLSQKGISYLHDIYAWYEGQPRQQFIDKVLLIETRRCAAMFELLTKDINVLVANLTIADRFSHFYWHELEHDSPYSEQESAIFTAYCFLDKALGRLLDEAGSSSTILVFSEIGFGPLRQYISVNDYLASVGFLKSNGQSSCKHILWPETQAFEAVQGTHGVNINVSGEFEHGCVDRHDYVSVRAAVQEYLGEIVNPYTGLKLFNSVHTREEVYDGEATRSAPDLILQPADARYLPFGDPLWATHVNRRFQSGWHRPDGFWVAAGPHIPAGRGSSPATLEDIAPTILRILGKDIPREFPGQPLL